jgi:hypothetical protein
MFQASPAALGALRRSSNASASPLLTPRIKHWYPLRTWGYTRSDCIRIIEGAGLPVPLKSACFFCAVSKPDEFRYLAYHHPDLLRRAIEMEDNARKRGFTKIEGLGCKGNKEMPGSWRLFAAQEGFITERKDGGFDLVKLDMADAPEWKDSEAPQCMAA